MTGTRGNPWMTSSGRGYGANTKCNERSVDDLIGKPRLVYC